jgi:hypothetical protein
MSDFNSITQNGQLCDSKGQLTASQFEIAMRAQLKYYTHRQLCDCIAHGEASESEIAQVELASVHSSIKCYHSISWMLNSKGEYSSLQLLRCYATYTSKKDFGRPKHSSWSC